MYSSYWSITQTACDARDEYEEYIHKKTVVQIEMSIDMNQVIAVAQQAGDAIVARQ
jgi:hypothetical protein